MNYILRKWNQNEYKDFYDASNDNDLYNNMTEGFPRTLEDCKKMVVCFSESKEKTEYVRAICINNKPVGCIGVFFGNAEYAKSCEIAYWISKEYRGKGLMQQVGKEFINMIYDNYDVHRIHATPLEMNKPSRRILEEMGFICEGVLHDYVWKNGKFLNSIIYAYIR